MFPLSPWATAHSYQSLADESILGAQGITLSSDVAAHETQVTQDTFEQSNAFSFMNHSDWYKLLSWNKLGIKDNKSEGQWILAHTSVEIRNMTLKKGIISFNVNLHENFWLWKCHLCA